MTASAGDDDLREAVRFLQHQVESLLRLEPLFIESTAVLRLEIQSVRSQLAEQEDGPGTAAELRAELEAVRAQLRDQHAADQRLFRAELRTALRETGAGAGEDQGQVAAVVAALRADIQALREEVAGRDALAEALAKQESQARAAIAGEVAALRAEIRALPSPAGRPGGDERVSEAIGEAVGVAVAQQSGHLLDELQLLLRQQDARHGEDIESVHTLLSVATDSLRAALLADTASARAAFSDQAQRLRDEVHAIWARLREQQAEDQASLRTALAESQDVLRREVAALAGQTASGAGTGGDEHVRSLRGQFDGMAAKVAAAQAAAQDDLAALRGRIEAFTGLVGSTQAAAHDDVAQLRDRVDALAAAIDGIGSGARADAAAIRSQLDALGMDLAAAPGVGPQIDQVAKELTRELAQARATAHEDGASVRDRLDAIVATMRSIQTSAQNDVKALRSRVDELAAVARDDADAVRVRIDALLTEVRDQVTTALHDQTEQVRSGITAAASARESVADRIEQVGSEMRRALDDTSELVNTVLARQPAAFAEQLDATMAKQRAALGEQLAATLAASRTALVEQIDQLLRRSGDELRTSLLVEQTDLVQGELAGQVESVRSAVEAVVAPLVATAADERSAEVEALLAAVAGNEERLHELISTALAADRAATQAAFAAAEEDRQAQLAYLEGVLQTFNQALALERQEVGALVKWGHDATEETVGQVAADVAGRLDAIGGMVSRVLAGEGELEITEAIAAVRADIAKLNKKLTSRVRMQLEDDLIDTLVEAVRRASGRPLRPGAPPAAAAPAGRRATGGSAPPSR